MNLLLLEPEDYIAPGRVQLRERRLAHIRDVLAAADGSSLRVGDINGLTGRGEIVCTGPDSVILEVVLDQPPPAKLPLTLILALPRPKMLRRALRTVAELGVRELILLNTWKVEKSYWLSPALAPAAVRGYLLEGLQQARDTVLPAVRLEQRFKPFVEDRLPGVAADTTALVAHPGAGADCPVALNAPCTLAVGPEGGFTDYEVGKLRDAGLQPVQLGARILRVENAVTAVVARLFT